MKTTRYGRMLTLLAIFILPPLVFVLALSLALTGCATMKTRKQCRVQCEHERGPVHTWFGGPTIPPEAWDRCMHACEATE